MSLADSESHLSPGTQPRPLLDHHIDWSSLGRGEAIEPHAEDNAGGDNPLTRPLLQVLRLVRAMRGKVASYRELLSTAIQLLDDLHDRDARRQEQLDALREELRRYVSVQVSGSTPSRITRKHGHCEDKTQ